MSQKEYAEFTDALGKLGFDNFHYHLPYMREEEPQMIVSFVTNPIGVKLQVKQENRNLFEVQRIEYIDMYKATLRQIEFNIERFYKKVGDKNVKQSRI